MYFIPINDDAMSLEYHTIVKSSCDKGSWCERNCRGVEGGRVDGGWW